MIRWALLLTLVLAGPAHAGFIGAIFSTVASAFGGATLLGIVGRVVLSAAISAYQRRRMKKAMAQQQVGIKTQFTGTGGTTPLTVIVGRYATNGHLEAPQESQPRNSDPPNKYLTYVIGLGDLPGMSLTGRVVVNDDWAQLAGQTPGMEEYGVTVTGPFANKIWFRFRNGLETTADPFLLAKFGMPTPAAPQPPNALGIVREPPPPPERPWLPTMIGRGIPHVIVTCEADRTLFPGEPRLRFEVNGIPLYDPRRDSTVGGVGAHRWSDRSTWEFTENPKVIEYNIRRGLTIDGFGVWGGDASAEDLPLDNWFAAMNGCDVLDYRFGFEFGLDQTPADVINEINRSCDGDTVEVGGVYKTRVGGPALPVYFFTDGDVIVSRPQELDPFPSLDETFNAVTASFPDPDLLWEPREAPPLTNATWEQEDALLVRDPVSGQFVPRPRRLLRELSFPGVSRASQVQRLMSAFANRSRRGRNHGLTLPPAALVLEPLDVVSWTSARNGYAGKLFEIALVADPVGSTMPRVGLLEVDPSDDATPPFVPLPTPSPRRESFLPQPVIGFSASPFIEPDASGNPRRAGIRLTWDAAAMADTPTIAFELRLESSAEIIASGPVASPERGLHLIRNLLPQQAYQVRARARSDRPSAWTAWLDVTTPDVRLQPGDLGEEIAAEIDAAAERFAKVFGIEAVDSFSTTGLRVDQIVMKKPELTLHRWDGSQWTTQLFAGIAPGAVNIASFADGIRPIEIVDELPSTGNFKGRSVLLTTDDKIYRHTGNPAGSAGFTSAVPAQDLTGQLTDSQIAAISALKISGQIIGTQISDNAITTPKILAGSVTTPTMAAGAVTASRLAVGDFTNIVPNGDMNDPSAWSTSLVFFPVFGTSGWVFDSPVAYEFAWVSGQTGFSQPLSTSRFSVDAGRPYYFRYQTFASAGITYRHWGRVHWQNAAGAELPSSPVNFAFTTIAAVTNAGGSVIEHTAMLTPPVDAKFGIVRFYCERGPTTGPFRIGSVSCRRAASGELIVDGVITGPKIATDAVEAGKIAAAAVNAREIAANAVHVEKLSVLSREYVNPISVTGDLRGWGGVLENGTGSGPGLSYNSADRAIQLAGNQNHSVRSRTFRIDHNKIYRVAARVRKNIAGGTYWIGIQAASVDTEGLTQAENGAISGSLAVQEFSAGRAAGGNTNNSYFARGIAATTAFVDHVYFIVGANRSLADCPAHVGPGLTPFVQLPASAAFVALRFLNWDNAGTARNLLVRDVSVTEIGTGQIVADNIAANAITGDKITANAIGANQIAADAVTAAKIAAGAVTAEKISVANLSAISANLGTIQVGSANIANLAVERIKIAAGAVTSFNLLRTNVSFTGATTWGSDTLIGSHNVTMSSTPNLVPERVILRPRLDGFQPVLTTGQAGIFECYFRFRIRRNRGGVFTTLADYNEPFWNFVVSNGNTTCFYAGSEPNAVIQITQAGSYQAGDILNVEYYFNRWRSLTTVDARVGVSAIVLELEEYFR